MVVLTRFAFGTLDPERGRERWPRDGEGPVLQLALRLGIAEVDVVRGGGPLRRVEGNVGRDGDVDLGAAGRRRVLIASTATGHQYKEKQRTTATRSG